MSSEVQGLAVVWQVVGQDRLVTMEDRKDLPYIDAVITEILRVVTIGKFSLWSLTGKSSLWSPLVSSVYGHLLVSPVSGHHW